MLRTGYLYTLKELLCSLVLIHMAKIKIALISVSYGSESEIVKLFESLANEHDSPDCALHRFVVSNSGDCEALQDAQTTVIQSGFNAGFAKGCNLGANAAGDYDVLIFCNPDVRIGFADIYALSKQVLNNTDIGIVSPTFENNSGAVENFVESEGRIPGACYVMRNAVFKQVQGWDENFFLWGEDRDISERIVQLGLKIGHNMTIRAKHLSGHSWKDVSAEKNKFFTKVWVCSQTYLAIKKGNVFSGRMYCFFEALKSALRLILKKQPYGRAYDNGTAMAFCFSLLFSLNLRANVVHSKSGYFWQQK